MTDELAGGKRVGGEWPAPSQGAGGSPQQQPFSAPDASAAQHAGVSPDASAAQHAGVSPDASAAQHAGVSPDASAAQHAGSQVQAPAVRRAGRTVERVAKQGRRHVRILGAAGAAAALAAVVFVTTRPDEPSSRPAGPVPAAGSEPISVTSTVAGADRLSGTVGAQDTTTIPFTADAGSVSYFAADAGCTDNGLQWVVEDAAGVPLSSAAVICGDIGRVEFPATAEYRVRVYSVGGDDTDTSFSIDRLPSRSDSLSTLIADETTAGNIDLPGARDVFNFDAEIGAVGYFSSEPCASSGLQWVIEDASGAAVAGAAVICGDIGRIVFPATGQYRARVYSVDGGTGEYQILWTTSRQDLERTITSGASVEGDIDRPGAQDLYTFDADGGDVAYFAADDSCDVDHYWLVEDAAGSAVSSTAVMCGDIGRVAFISAGQYRVRVYSISGSTGVYRFSWLASRPEAERSLSFGAASGRIDAPGARDVWTFDAPAGAQLELSADPQCVDDDLRWFVEAADGTALSSTTTMCNDIGIVSLPDAGRFRIVVYGDGQVTGAYAFTARAG